METNKTNTGEKKEDQEKENKSETNNEGFGLSAEEVKNLLKIAKDAELITHLLTGLAAMGGNYFLWIRPMQDKMKKMEERIKEQENHIEELEADIDKIKKELEIEPEEGERKRAKSEFFTFKGKDGTYAGFNGKLRRVDL